ncbi:LuxR C-terminal-related transcriptional regulator [Nonomuraea polychroma]|uniref:LuxR C-terminal-related transcriptional regulator n=1 Tax=Nonomuraea polychroma TaxID=46176 RepID=UPI003D930135
MRFPRPGPGKRFIGGSDMRGREREWRHVDGLLRTLRRCGGTLLVDGEPGAGKSRLLAEAAATASARGIPVVQGGVAELGELVPCGVLLEALDLGAEPADDVPVGSGTRLLDRLVAAFDARGPVLAVLDDLHRADPATLKTLHTLHGLLAGRPVGWLLSRSTAVRDGPAAALFDLLERHGAARTTLPPLSPDAATALAADILGERPDTATQTLVAAAGGNPLLITELLAGLRDEGLLGTAGPGVPLPARLRAVVRSWIDLLGAEARSLVKTAAVFSGSLSFEDAASLLGTTPAALLPAMEESTAAGVLVVTAHGLTFRHELVGDVVAAWVPPPVRRALLEQFGMIEEAVTAAGPTVAVMESMIAEGRLREAERVVRRRLADHGSVTGMAELRSLLAEIMYLTGRGEEAVREAETVLAVPGLPQHVRDRAILVRLYAVTRRRSGGAAAAYANEVVEERSRHGPAATAAALIALTTAAREEGRFGDALALAEDARRLTEDACRPAEQARRPAGVGGPERRRYEVCLLTAALLTDVRRLDEARVVLRQARKEMFANGHLAWAADASAVEARAELAEGRLDGAVGEAERALDLAGALDTPLSAEEAAAVVAAVALRRGDLREATRHVADPPEGSLETRTRHALLAARITEAKDGPHSAMPLLTGLSWPLSLAVEPTAAPWLVRVALAADDRSAAESVAAAADALSRANPRFPALAAAAVHVRGLLDGDRDALARAAEQAADTWARASAEEDLGVALDAAGQREEAARSLDRALGAYVETGSARDAARIRQRLRGLGVRHRHWNAAKRPASGWDSLTETEYTVSLLVVDGWTNRQIAEQMFISVHTVTFHLRQVYRKLSINSRVELARLAVAQGRVDPGRAHDGRRD